MLKDNNLPLLCLTAIDEDRDANMTIKNFAILFTEFISQSIYFIVLY